MEIFGRLLHGMNTNVGGEQPGEGMTKGTKIHGRGRQEIRHLAPRVHSRIRAPCTMQSHIFLQDLTENPGDFLLNCATVCLYLPPDKIRPVVLKREFDVAH
jgi:hypothetical protein